MGKGSEKNGLATILVGLFIAYGCYYYLSNPGSFNSFFQNEQEEANSFSSDVNFASSVTDRGNVSDIVIAAWVREVVAEIMTFDFTNVDQRIESNRRFFNDHGFEGFNKALEVSRMKESLIQNKLSQKIVLKGEPVINSQGVVNGRYQWIIDTPVDHYVSGDKQRVDNWVITLVIVRDQNVQNELGIGIHQFIAVPR